MAIIGKQAFEKAFYTVINEAIGTKIGGKLYRPNCRPLNSSKEDAVIVVSTATASQIQEGRAKLNIFVADIDSKSGNKIPNIRRLEVVEKLDDVVLAALNDNLLDYDFWKSSMTDTLTEEATKEHFININIGFKHKTF